MVHSFKSRFGLGQKVVCIKIFQDVALKGFTFLIPFRPAQKSHS